MKRCMVDMYLPPAFCIDYFHHLRGSNSIERYPSVSENQLELQQQDK